MIVQPPAKRSDGYNKHRDYGDIIDVHIMEFVDFFTDQIVFGTKKLSKPLFGLQLSVLSQDLLERSTEASTVCTENLSLWTSWTL